MAKKENKKNKKDFKNSRKFFLILGIILAVMGIIFFILSMSLLNINYFYISFISLVIGAILIILSLFKSISTGHRMFYKTRPKWQDPY